MYKHTKLKKSVLLYEITCSKISNKFIGKTSISNDKLYDINLDAKGV